MFKKNDTSRKTLEGLKVCSLKQRVRRGQLEKPHQKLHPGVTRSRFISQNREITTRSGHCSTSLLRFSWQARGILHFAISSTNQPCVYFPTALAGTGHLKTVWKLRFPCRSSTWELWHRHVFWVAVLKFSLYFTAR
jgi:hypothetical protein